MRKIFFALFVIFVSSTNAQTPKDKVINITVTTNTNPASITLNWDTKSYASSYQVFRKLRNELTFTALSASLFVTSYTDNTVLSNVGYEYKVQTNSAILQGIGFIYASVNLPAKHNVGRLIVLIDSAYINYCSIEIKQYLADIVKEGWRASVNYIGRNQTVQSVKQTIKTLYNQDLVNTKGVFLLGHITIPYSGIIAPDGHNDHTGAWPTDWYYADTIPTFWTDISANYTTSTRPENRNIPGDGKFDRSDIFTGGVTVNPSTLFVARVDLFNMPTININDSLLIKNYLIKDHSYRSMQKTFRMRALVDDNFGYASGEAFSQNGYRNGGNILGKENVYDGDYMTSMSTEANSYLWSYGCGGGWFQGASGVGTTTDFQSTNINSVFTILFGSYFGDWDNTDNFLRAPLASPSPILTNCWGGRPNWNFHPMVLGEPIGFSTLIPFKTSTYTSYGNHSVHISFLGDPTLRMFLFLPASNITLSTSANAVTCAWTASPDPAVTGYYVYRANSILDTFKLLNTVPITDLSFTDNSAIVGKNVYMVKACKLQNTIGGNFQNLSTGIIDSINKIALPIQLISFIAQEKNCKVEMKWEVATEDNTKHYEIWRSIDGVNFDTKIGVVNALGTNAGSQMYALTDNVPNYKNVYKLISVDKNNTKNIDKVAVIELQNCDVSKLNSVILYPNPANDFLQIEIRNRFYSGQVKFIVTDAKGRKILSQENTITGASLKLPTAKLAKGLYFVSIEFSNGVKETRSFEK
jgi:hypothetical protein